MTDTTIGGERFDFGRVIGQTFSLVGRNFIWFALLALIFVGIPQFGLIYGRTYAAQAQPELVAWFSFGGAVVSMITTYILQAALTRAAVDDLSGKGVRLGAAIGDGLAYFFPLFVVALLVGLGVFVGLILLVIPGIILAVRWSVAAPVVVMERKGPTGAMERSADLTEGYRWAIFGLLLITLIFAYAVDIGVALLASSTATNLPSWFPPNMVIIAFGSLSATSTALVTLINIVAIASLYFELRRVKEGVGVEDLAKVFD